MSTRVAYGLDVTVWRNLLGRATVFYAVRTRLAELYEMSINPAHRVIYRALDDLYDTVEHVAAHSSSDTAAIASLVLDYTERLSGLLSRESITEGEARLLEQIQELIPRTTCRDPFRKLLGPSSKTQPRYMVTSGVPRSCHWRGGWSIRGPLLARPMTRIPSPQVPSSEMSYRCSCRYARRCSALLLSRLSRLSLCTNAYAMCRQDKERTPT